MQNDEMIWNIINEHYCSFKTTMRKALSDKTQFCKHPYSVTGLCNRTSCPLANSRYATLREDDGRVYLCIKTVERAHSPKNLWERILLSRNYAKALAQIDEHLQFFSKIMLHRNKQRLTKIHQYLIRMRKIELKARAGRKAKIVSAPTRKIRQREERRERKALVAAKLEKEIEKELTERLAKGTYGDLYNFPEAPYAKALDTAKEEEEETESETEMEDQVEFVEDLATDDEELDEQEDFEDMEYLGNNQWGAMSSDSDDNDDDESASEDESKSSSDDDSTAHDSTSKKKRKKKQQPAKKRGPRIEIEYEEEREDTKQAVVAAQTNW